MFGVDQPVLLQMYARDLKALDGVRLELEDTCAPMLPGVTISGNYEEAFGDADYACLVGSTKQENCKLPFIPRRYRVSLSGVTTQLLRVRISTSRLSKVSQ